VEVDSMPLPPAIQSLVQQPRFWSDYWGNTDPDLDEETVDIVAYPELKDCPIAFPVSSDYALLLEFSETLLRPDHTEGKVMS
jgi:hypothetical protein